MLGCNCQNQNTFNKFSLIQYKRSRLTNSGYLAQEQLSNSTLNSYFRKQNANLEWTKTELQIV
jgi:hypothetical protein